VNRKLAKLKDEDSKNIDYSIKNKPADGKMENYGRMKDQ